MVTITRRMRDAIRSQAHRIIDYQVSCSVVCDYHVIRITSGGLRHILPGDLTLVCQYLGLNYDELVANL